MAYLTARCPYCGIKINFSESSIDTLRRCEACSKEFVLRAAPSAPYSSGGCVGLLLALLFCGAAAAVGLGFVFWMAIARAPSVAVEAQPAVVEAQPAPVAPVEGPVETTAAPAPEPAPKELKTEPAPALNPDVRTWSDKSGKFSTEAKFGGMLGTTVTLHKADGTTVKLDLEQLSDSDRAWIAERRKSHP